MGHAFEHCEFKGDSKTKRFGKKKNAFSGLDFFLQPLLLSRVVPAVGQQRTDTVSWNNIYAKRDSDIAISVTNVKTNRVIVSIVNTCKKYSS